MPVPAYKLDWLFKRNADAERYYSEDKICDSINSLQHKIIAALKTANYQQDIALQQKSYIRMNDSLKINSQQLDIIDLNTKVSNKNKVIIAESSALIVVIVLLVLF